MKNKHIIITGPPSHLSKEIAALLNSDFNYEIFDVSRIVMDEMKNKTDLGIKMDAYLKANELIPDTIMNELIIEREKIIQMVFVGYPRTPNQFQLICLSLEIGFEQFTILQIDKKDRILDFLADKCEIIDFTKANHKISGIRELFKKRVV